MRQLLKVALLGSWSICALAVAAQAADTNDDAAAVEMKAHVQTLLPNAVLMAPIPDSAATAEIAEPQSPLEIELNAKNCLAKAIYFEARGESKKGQEAVAEVVLTRTRRAGYPKTVCGVVYEGSSRSTGCQFSFTCDGVSDTVRDRTAWARAKRVANLVLSGRAKPVAQGATHYHADWVSPYWAAGMKKVVTIGSHVFYRN